MAGSEEKCGGYQVFELTAVEWGAAAVAAVILGMAKAGVAGVGMIAIPLLASVFPAKVSVGVMLPMLIFGDVLAVGYYHRHADWKILWRLLPMAVLGIIIGYFLMNVINDAQLKVSIGAIVFTLVLLTVLRDQGILRDSRIPSGFGVALVTGVVAGITTMLANAAGPVMLVYLLAMKYPKNEFIGTSAWFFMIVNWIKIPFSVHLGLITWESFGVSLRLAPVLLAGGVLGILVVKRLSDRVYMVWVQALAGIAALKLLLL